jgi:hypothetical protein
LSTYNSHLNLPPDLFFHLSLTSSHPFQLISNLTTLLITFNPQFRMLPLFDSHLPDPLLHLYTTASPTMGSIAESTTPTKPSLSHPQPSLQSCSGFIDRSLFPTSQKPQYICQSQTATPSSAGRKRTREDAADNLEDYFAAAPAPVQDNEDGWVYGEGMTLIRPNGFIIDASSQTGTWAEEKVASRQPVVSSSPERPILRNHKSQRLDMTSTPAISEQAIGGNAHTATSSPTRSSQGPTVDDFTIYLGIGWSRLSDDEHIQAAARGWAKYIENHFPVSEPQIRLQSRGLASYLVETREGWYLFGEDLKQGRLVSRSLEQAFEHLRTSPPRFDSDDVLTASAESPRMEVDGEAEEKRGDKNAKAAHLNGSVNGSTNGPILNGINDLGHEHPVLVTGGHDEMDMS